MQQMMMRTLEALLFCMLAGLLLLLLLRILFIISRICKIIVGTFVLCQV